MLLSTVQSNECGYVDHQIKNILSEVNEEALRLLHQDFTDERDFNEKSRIKGQVFNKNYNSLFNRSNSTSRNTLTIGTSENGDKENYVDESSENGKNKILTRKLTIKGGWDSDEGNNRIKMNLKSESTFGANDKSYPTRLSPKTNGNTPLNSNQDPFRFSAQLYDDRSNCLGIINSSKINSNPGLSASYRSISKEPKMHISTDDDTNFDIFDIMKCSDDGVTDCTKPYCDKDDLTLNEDLVDKYERNLGLDIVKDKNICWAAGNFDIDVCPLKNYDVSNENSLINFSKESPDCESRDSFPQDWVFDENIDYVSQEQVPDPHVIIPKKTVDITKIKGWRKKQFTVEKCLANRNSILKKANLRSDIHEKGSGRDVESTLPGDNIVSEEQNKDYAFVCDKLDDFLDQEAELKINYEIPHLYAEYGIKLTSEELVSRPKFKLTTNNSRFPIQSANQNILPQRNVNMAFYAEKAKTEEKHSSTSSLIKKPNTKTKCAFPNKSHKNWSLWKVNNLSKGKPMSLLKRELSQRKENTTAVTSPCRRSGRISKAALSKSNTSVNPVANERRNYLSDSVNIETVSSELKPSTRVTKRVLDFGSEYNFNIRKFGMVLYPGPSAPLNPFITYHLQKIRSYRTLIDKQWANFAASAVVQKGKTENRKRMILPVTCCFKYKNDIAAEVTDENHAKVEINRIQESFSDGKDCISDNKFIENEFINGRRDKIRRTLSSDCSDGERDGPTVKRRRSLNRLSVDSALTRKINEGKIDLYEEEIHCGEDSKDEIVLINTSSIDNGWDNLKNFSEDSNLCWEKCDIVFEKRKQKTSFSNCIRENLRDSPEVIDIEDDTEVSSTVRLSPDASQTAFNKVIAKLLTKKLNELKQTENVTSSIDNLKTVKVNALELIKLNFIKENYLSGYINLWYLKLPETGKSRVFLTFSMSPPVESAINLKMMSRCSDSDPPNIIQEIITKDKAFDSNDLAILYCDGKHWEIHGSVNFAVDKSCSELEGNDKMQVFHLTKKVFPELEMLHDIKQKNDKNKVLKWWVMHMMQDYTEITVRYGEKIGRISRSIIIKTWKTKVPSFIEFKGLDNVRPIGVGVNPRLWPYFLIGPYYMGDHHNLTLKLNSKIVPFEYYLPLDRVKSAFLLKRFVSSVIMHSWRNCRQVVGMWLYDRIATRQSSFLQVRTRVRKTVNYEPSMEHDYSLCKSPDDSFESIVQYDFPSERMTEKNKSQPTREIFLVPDVPHLGYIKGELHPDQSITIEHPLKPDRKRNSHRIGDWLNRIMRKRIKFYPNDFYVKWKIVKNADVIRNLEPLDRSSLGGTHILCKKGIFYLLSLTKEKITKLELDESVVMDAILNNPIIQEVVELKELGKILLKKDSCDIPMSDVLQMALNEIEKLEKEDISLRKSRIAIQEERALLCRKLLETLNYCEIDENSKRSIDFYLNRILESERKGEAVVSDSKSEKENFRRLQAINVFLRSIQIVTTQENTEISQSCTKMKKEMEQGFEDKISKENPIEDEKKKNAVKEEKFGTDNEKVRELESKIKALHESLDKMSGDDGSLYDVLTKRLNAMSQHLEKMKRSHNMNGKLSPIIGEIACTAAEQYLCQDSFHPNHASEKENAGILSTKDPLENDTHSYLVGCQDKGNSLEVTHKLNKVVVSNKEISQTMESNTISLVAGTEKETALTRVTSPKPSLLSENYVNKRPSAEENGSNSLCKTDEIASEVIEEIIFDEMDMDSESQNKNLICSDSESPFGSAEVNQPKAAKIIENDEMKFEELAHERRVFIHDRMRPKTSKSSVKHVEEKIIRNVGKSVRLQLLKPNFLAIEKTSEKLNGHIEYIDGRRVLFINNKRKKGGRSYFLKKLRRS